MAAIAEQLALQYPSENPTLAKAHAANKPLAGIFVALHPDTQLIQLCTWLAEHAMSAFAAAQPCAAGLSS